jgi:replicative DNA helicase
MAKLPETLPIKPISLAVEEAKAQIQIERSGKVTGLYTRWAYLNRAFFKYFRFRSITAIPGMSGSGKSAILNMIEDDFSNPELNPSFFEKREDGTFKPKIAILAFKYEMDAYDEVLRTLSGKVKKSYANLLSSEMDEEASRTLKKEVYNQVSDEQYEVFCKKLDELKSKPIYYIESAGNLDQLYKTCHKFKSENPTVQLVITLDHSLLSQKLSEKDDLELSANTAHTAIRLKKTLGAMVIFLMQMNGEIEKPIRRDNPALHFPIKTDIHCGNQVYWACDNVLIFHRPELLNIEKYGNKPFPMITKGLIHCAFIKSRKNKPCNLVFEDKFSEGNMQQTTPDAKKWKASNFDFQ